MSKTVTFVGTIAGQTKNRRDRYQVSIDAKTHSEFWRAFGNGIDRVCIEMSGGIYDVQMVVTPALLLTVGAATGKNIRLTVTSKPYNFIDQTTKQRRTGINLNVIGASEV